MVTKGEGTPDGTFFLHSHTPRSPPPRFHTHRLLTTPMQLLFDDFQMASLSSFPVAGWPAVITAGSLILALVYNYFPKCRIRAVASHDETESLSYTSVHCPSFVFMSIPMVYPDCPKRWKCRLLSHPPTGQSEAAVCRLLALANTTYITLHSLPRYPSRITGGTTPLAPRYQDLPIATSF
jgi:hypothetical protein